MEIDWLSITDLDLVNKLIKAIQRDKRTYQARVNSADVRTENSAEDNSENANEMTDVQSQLDASNTRFATLVPETRSYK